MINSKMVGEFLETMIEDFVDHLEYKYGFEGAFEDEANPEDDVEYYDSEAFGEVKDIINTLTNPKKGYNCLSDARKEYLLSGLGHLKGDLEKYLTEIADIQDPEAEAEAIINFIKEDVK